MKRREWLLVLAVVAAVLGVFVLRDPLPTPDGILPITADTQALLWNVRVREFHIEPASLDDTLARLDRAVRSYPSAPDVRFVRWTGKELPARYRATRHDLASTERSASGSVAPGSSGFLPAIQRRLSFDNEPANELIRQISRVFRCAVAERGETIYFIPDAEAYSPMYQRVYVVSSRLRLPADPKTWLEEFGIDFGEGAYVLARGDRLVIHNTREQHYVCAAALGAPVPTLMERVAWWYESQKSNLRVRMARP